MNGPVIPVSGGRGRGRRPQVLQLFDGKRLADWRVHQLAIDVVQKQRQALYLSRWAYLNETGAFELRDAAALLSSSVDGLQIVSDAILRELPRYSSKAWARVS